MTDRILARDYARIEPGTRSRPARKPGAQGVVVTTDAVISGAAAPVTISTEANRRWRRMAAHGAHQHPQRNGDCGANPKRENARVATAIWGGADPLERRSGGAG